VQNEGWRGFELSGQEKAAKPEPRTMQLGGLGEETAMDENAGPDRRILVV